MRLEHARKATHLAINILGVLLLLVVIGFAWLAWSFNRPPFDMALLEKLEPGMSKQEVREILGAPSSDFGDHWAYGRFMAWPIVYVRFDESERFTKSEYDY